MPRFLAELKRRGPGNFVDIPFDPREVFGEARRLCERRESKAQR